MPNWKILNQRSVSVLYLMLVCALAGCVRFDPDETVLIEVTGVIEEADRAEVLEVLETMYDKDAGAKRLQSRYNDRLLSVKMYPVSDVEAFSRRINFGTVTDVSGRTVKVQYARRQYSPPVI
jgi:hypothetical protein